MMVSGGVVVYLCCRYTSATNFEIVVVLSAMSVRRQTNQ